MMNTIEDFLSNPEFVRWVKLPDNELDIYWKNWMDANPGSIPQIKTAKEMVMGIHFMDIKPSPGLKSDVLTAILKESNVKADLNLYHSIQTYKPKLSFWERLSHFYRVAAILLIALLIPILLIPAKQEANPTSVSALPVMIEKSTSQGEKLVITLPDGSTVRINSASSIVYPEVFDKGKREVTLIGEAYFEVEEDPSKPFTVLTDYVSTTALGTSFNVTAYPSEETNIALLTGEVSVHLYSAEDEPMLLVKGESAKFTQEDSRLIKGEFDEAQILAWTKKEIIFDNTNLEKAIRVLENWYGVDIDIENAPRKSPLLTGRFQDETLKNVLEGLSYSVKFEFEIKDNLVIIKF
jgi:ferric-dicitrate binding protein FerR (iron transport regulator)